MTRYSTEAPTDKDKGLAHTAFTEMKGLFRLQAELEVTLVVRHQRQHIGPCRKLYQFLVSRVMADGKRVRGGLCHAENQPCFN